MLPLKSRKIRCERLTLLPKKRGRAVKKTKFSEEQIAFALKQAETGTTVDEVCRKMGICQATFYKWKQK